MTEKVVMRKNYGVTYDVSALNKQMQSSQPNGLFKLLSSKCLCNEKKQEGIIL